jgi:hypothetical protein
MPGSSGVTGRIRFSGELGGTSRVASTAITLSISCTAARAYESFEQDVGVLRGQDVAGVGSPHVVEDALQVWATSVPALTSGIDSSG